MNTGDTSVWQGLIDAGNNLLSGVLSYQSVQAQNQVATTQAATAALAAQSQAITASRPFLGLTTNSLLLLVAAGLGAFLIYKKA